MNSDEVMIVNEEEDEITIDFLGIFHAIAKKWYIVLFVAVAFGFALGAYGRFVVKDAYEAEASMCIIDSNKEVSMSDLQVGSALTNDYEGIIKSRVVLTKVIANLKLDIEYKGLYNAVSIENPDGTRIIKINVVSQDQKEAVDIANEILQISIEEIPNVLGSSVPTVLDKADILFTENTRHSILFYSVIGVAIGMFFACGIIALTVITNVSVKTDEDVQKCTGLSVLGAIPDYKGKKQKKIMWPEDLPFNASEAIYQLRTGILYSSKDVKTIVVTSAFENQGKSFISFHLAYSLSQVGKRVLLVDTDMRKSVLQRRMGLEGVKLGLSEYLSGNAEVGQVIYDVGIPNMHVLFSGKLVTNASALLSAKWLRTLCDSVKDSYDYIIFDTPPVGVVGDAAIVSSVCDGTLLVIENGVTKKKTLCQITAELERVDTNILGVVQNMVGSKKDSSYYGKGNYGYYYGNYGNNQNKK
ncbi:MAG: polysaccharide biosynthesis tyrosine autokinase [Firmicutes bacterium]|nr:polysaccharide biosynthesis tyrosine autokinase [Bacillota bacterium]